MKIPSISRIKHVNPGALSPPVPGRRIQKPRRTLRKVISATREGFDSSPMCEDAAAPETAMAVARSAGAPFVFHSAVGL